jgi:hypothetical protein
MVLPGGGYGTAGKTGYRTLKHLDQVDAAAAHADDAVASFRTLENLDDATDVGKAGKQADDAPLVKVEPGCDGNSFSAETLVATSEGPKPIHQIAIGDVVLGYNEATRTTGFYPVTDVLVHLDLVGIDLTLDGEKIETTPEHPFFVLLHGWVAAADLEVGNAIRQADGTYGSIEAIVLDHQPQVMYNLTVDTAHTFFVGAGQWLVHNASCIVSPIVKTQKSAGLRELPFLSGNTLRLAFDSQGLDGPVGDCRSSHNDRADTEPHAGWCTR